MLKTFEYYDILFIIFTAIYNMNINNYSSIFTKNMTDCLTKNIEKLKNYVS